MIKLNGKKITANQFAKEIVLDKGALFDYWAECPLFGEYKELMTEKEIDAIEQACQKQFQRVKNFLGL